MTGDDTALRRARKRVHELKDFYGHLVAYIFINVVLAIINLVSSPDQIWFIFPLFGWGIGLTIHALATFNFFVFTDEWEEKKVHELAAKYRASANK